MAAEKINYVPQDVMTALDTMRETLKNNLHSQAETKAVVSKCESLLDKYDEVEVARLNEKKANDDVITRLQDQFIGIEKSLTRFSSSAPEYSAGKAELKEFSKWMRFGLEKKGLFTEQEEKLLRTDDNINGGFLAPDEFLAIILKKIVEISPVRSVARVMKVSANAVQMPTRETLVDAAYVGEAVQAAESNSTYGLETLNLTALVAATRATNQMLMDPNFDLENQMQQDVAQAIAKVSGEKFVRGTGVTQPEGFMTNTKVAEIVSGVANDISGDALIELTGELASGQNPIFAFNRRTKAVIRSLKDSAGAFLFHLDTGLQTGLGSSIVGFPFIEMIDMDDVAVDTFPIIFGDFDRGYLIIDGTSLQLIRDINTEARSNIILFVWTVFNGGQVVLPDAFLKMKVST